MFSGIGGLDLGLERAGMTVVWQSEIDPYACRVLAKHWPTVPNLGDVTKIDWSSVERVDVICGGFPCQPISSSGLRRLTDDPRWLWPQVAHAVRVLRPRYVLLENVADLLVRGFGDVASDLASAGYDLEWSCFPAAALGLPQRRWRTFVVAHRDGLGLEAVEERDGSRALALRRPDAHRLGEAELAASQAASRVRGVGDGVPAWMDRVRTLGNAVVPQVAEHIGRRLMEAA